MKPSRSVEWALDNCYTLARRELRRLTEYIDGDGTLPKTIERWGHIVRLCEEAGCQPHGVLRESVFLRVSEGGSPQEQECLCQSPAAPSGMRWVCELKDGHDGECIARPEGAEIRWTRPPEHLRAPLPAQAPGVLEQLIKQCQKDAVAHRQEAQAIKRTHPLATRPAYTCEEVLAQVHEYWAKEMEAALAAVGRTPEDGGQCR